MTSRQALVIAAGLTQASSVTAVLKRSAALSGTLTSALTPLNARASPNLPAVVQVAFVRVPVLPLPDASAALVPVPSLKPKAATRAGFVVEASVVAAATFE